MQSAAQNSADINMTLHHSLLRITKIVSHCHHTLILDTSGAIDNWDHKGTNVSEHDTVTVLFQDKPPSSILKHNVSDTKVAHGTQAFKTVLPCQILSDFYKPAHRPDLPETYKVPDDEYASTEATASTLKDIPWSLARLDVKQDDLSEYPESQSVPSWSASNSIWD